MIPTLIIGLGGAGSRVVTNVYKKFMESNPAANECDRFICLCFDTDSIDTLDCSMILPEGNVVNIAPNLPLIAVYEHFKNKTLPVYILTGIGIPFCLIYKKTINYESNINHRI